MYDEPITKDGQHLFRELDEYLNQRLKEPREQLPDNIKAWSAIKMREQTRKAEQTGIIDHIRDGD